MFTFFRTFLQIIETHYDDAIYICLLNAAISLNMKFYKDKYMCLYIYIYSLLNSSKIQNI